MGAGPVSASGSPEDANTVDRKNKICIKNAQESVVVGVREKSKFFFLF